MTDWTEARVVRKKQWTPRLFSLEFDADINPFKAGQFLRLGLDLEGERIGRPYSLINAPGEQPHEIYFNLVAGGKLSPRLAALETGDTLWTGKSPLGFLVIDEVPAAEQLWLLATGTGIGPFISILKTAQPWQRFKKIVLAHSVRLAAELAYIEIIDQLRSAHQDQLTYLPFVSREEVPQTLHGRIPAAIADGRLEQSTGLTLTPDNSHVMLCGNPDMIEDIIELLGQRGMRRHRRREPGHLSSEAYF